jgi:hypothetical protein
MKDERLKDLSVDADGRLWFEPVPGLKAEVVSDAECARADFVVCAPVSYFGDDVHTTCAFCGAAIVHRPYMPSGPPKICVACMLQTCQKEES